MIENVSNEYFKRLCKLNRKKYRDKSSEHFDILLEGERLINQTIDFGVKVKSFFVRHDKINQYQSILSKASCPIFLLSKKQSNELTETNNEQGIFIKIEFSERFFQQPIHSVTSPILYLNNISDPGNLGTIIRTASAFHIKGLILDTECCELSNSKLIRASLGAVFKVPLHIVDKTWLKTRKEKIFICDATEGISMKENRNCLRVPSIVVIGSEAHGVSEYISLLAHEKININMPGKMQSLNVAIVAGILMYEMHNSHTKDVE